MASRRERTVTELPSLDVELVIHCFAPGEGPAADEAYEQLRRVWAACREQMGMTEPIAGLPVLAVLPETRDELPGGEVIAAAESPLLAQQAVLRRVSDVLNLSVLLARPAPEARRSIPSEQSARTLPSDAASRRMSWAEFADMWAQVNPGGAEAMLGEARLFIARLQSGGANEVEASADLGQSLAPLLPLEEGRPRDWWKWGTTTSDGFALWDTGTKGETSSIREIVLVAAASRDADVSAWAWSDGTSDLPPFARYLLHAANVRYEARLLDSLQREHPHDGAEDALGKLTVALASEAPHLNEAERLRLRLSRLHAEESRLGRLEVEMVRLRRTATVVSANLSQAAVDEVGRGGLFAADRALARWLLSQLAYDLGYVRIELKRAARTRALIADEINNVQFSSGRDYSGASDSGQSASLVPSSQAVEQADASRRVFVVHGRDAQLTRRFFDLLLSVGLVPLEWETIVEASGSTSPYLGQVAARASRLAQGALVLLTPDEVSELHPDLYAISDLPFERARSGQSGPNVYFELGLVSMAFPDRTIVVEVGQLRPVADLAGLNVIRFDGSTVAIKKVLDRLSLAGCPVDYSGVDWLYSNRFSDLAAYRRGPETRQAVPGLQDGDSRYYSCFLSYSAQDTVFVRKLVDDLSSAGINCWLDTQDMQIGASIEQEIRRGLSGQDKLLLVLSQSSVQSQWVETELRLAVSLEREHGNEIVFPLRLDRSVFDSSSPLLGDLVNNRHVGDFEGWQDEAKYRKHLKQLVRDLTISAAVDLERGR